MKVFIKWVSVVFVIGIIGTFISLQVTGAFTHEVVDVFEEKKVKGSSIKYLSVDTSSADIYIEPSQDDTVYVQWGGKASKGVWEDYELKTTNKGGELSVKLRQKDILGFQFGFIQKDLKLTVMLPKKLYEGLSLSSSSGDIYINEQRSNNMSIKTSSGDMELVKVETSGELNSRSSSGTIRLKEVYADRLLTDTSSGDVIGEKIEVLQVTSDSSSGTIDYSELTLTGDLQIKTSSGDVYLLFAKVPDSYIIDYQSSSGDERVNLEGIEYERKAENEVKGQKGNGDQRIEIRTSSGDFNAQ
ncbi:hypothetical protein N780_13215 [Pontibacillus chungwhensis BH030062]|uniref:DUF4097 domain-containing protein n=1 Tax=Pontibacillus chungwhensis BH030062 TaxID=1385513 RepID=A0A0A2V3D3_9BACI|nr:DUF4097 family beta strand repeat-containing protein [Pontibacillus chungwhensis]KGP93311.1 hypothetical protein N780_13215 [Pontibacillus chungwhensis BH030062]